MKKFVIALIRFYQKYISSRTAPCCRFSPTCSQYGIEAVERFGAVKGSIMTLGRILRCNPFNAGGYDPVPEFFGLNKNFNLSNKSKRNFKVF